MYTHELLNTGWICPKCGNVYSPQVLECETCNAAPTITTTHQPGELVYAPVTYPRWHNLPATGDSPRD